MSRTAAMMQVARRSLCLLLMCAAGSCRSSGTSGEDLGDPEDVCDRYLACIAATTPAGVPEALDAYGPNGPCWSSGAEVRSVCLEACREGLLDYRDGFPAEAACTSCESESECPGSTSPGCGPEGRCVECSRDAHCGGEFPACSVEAGHCIGCTSDSHCSGDLPACSPLRELCVECTSDANCSGDRPACDTEREYCVECSSDDYCTGARPFCGGQVCAECTRDDHCPDERPWCNGRDCAVCDAEETSPENQPRHRATAYSCSLDWNGALEELAMCIMTDATTPLSPPCAECFALELECVRENCGDVCGPDIVRVGDPCASCACEAGCEAVFEDCSGRAHAGQWWC